MTKIKKPLRILRTRVLYSVTASSSTVSYDAMLVARCGSEIGITLEALYVLVEKLLLAVHALITSARV
jgi:hypothetical protein